MTDIYETKIETKEVKEEIYLHTVCDWCGSVIPVDKECDEERPLLDTTIEFRITVLCYDSPYGIVYRVDDLCKDCITKLIDNLKELGIKVYYNEWY